MDLELADLAKRDGRTDGQTDGRTDKPAYRDVWTHLKTCKRSLVSPPNETQEVYAAGRKMSPSSKKIEPPGVELDALSSKPVSSRVILSRLLT